MLTMAALTEDGVQVLDAGKNMLARQGPRIGMALLIDVGK
jgi:hypothetical protein